MDDKAGYIQISVTKQASLLKTYQSGAHSGACGFLVKTAPSLLPNPDLTELKLKDVLAHTMMSQQVQGTKDPTLLEEIIQRATFTPRTKSPKGQGLQVCISVGSGER